MWEKQPRYRHRGIASIIDIDGEANNPVTSTGTDTIDIDRDVDDLGTGTEGVTSSNSKRR